ncbi:MAG: Na(+) H(+) antiporter subunit A / Na(+) H(+) antiporter subunit B, partial [uncultured Ramlibacter sp.]
GIPARGRRPAAPAARCGALLVVRVRVAHPPPPPFRGRGRCDHRRGPVRAAVPGPGGVRGPHAADAPGLGARGRLERRLPAGRTGPHVRPADHRDRRAHRALRCLLPGRGGPPGQVLRAADAVHGGDAGRGAVRQPAAAGGVLGTHQRLVLPAGGLLGPSGRCAGWRSHGAGRHRRWRFGHARG